MPHERHASCIAACEACALACDHCASSCLKEPDVRMMARCISLDIDCAMVCRATAGAIARGSEFARRLCALCAEICEACGNECGGHPPTHCQSCARACRACAEECRRLAG